MVYERINNNFQIVKTKKENGQYNNIIDLRKSKNFLIKKKHFKLLSLIEDFIIQFIVKILLIK